MQRKEFIIHALFWILPFVYILFLTDNYIVGVFSRNSGTLTIPLIYGTLFNILLFYTIALIIVPKYFKKTGYIHYAIYIIVLLVGITLIESIVDLLYIQWINLNKSYHFLGDLFTGNLVIHIVFLGLSLAYAFSKETIKNEKNKQKLIHEKLNTELAYLKSQINPHFLFNILNNLFSLARENDDYETADGILKLSKMMRYMLYEGNIEKIPLSKETDYIENYINLQKLRFHPDDDIQIQFEKQGDLDTFMISPLLLIPFIENAFKHGISLEFKSKISILIQLKNNIFNFKVWNTKHNNFAKKQGTQEYSGFGLKNARNRLEMLYKGHYELDITDNEHSFSVALTINK